MATYAYTFQSGDGVTPTRLNDARTISDIVNADIKSDAAIAHSKLANITAGQVLLGNASNVPTATALTGDVTVTSGGVTAIGSAKVLPAMLSQPYTLATAQNSTSGAAINFPDIPSWAKKITVMFNGVSTSGSSRIVVRLGTSSGVVESGYTSFCGTYGRVTENYQDTASETTGFGWWNQAPADTGYGHMLLTNISGNTWVASHSGAVTASGVAYVIGGGGVVALASALDRVRITTASGTPTFDTGSINISYEG